MQHESAKSKRPDLQDVPTQQPMRQRTKPEQRRAPSNDQKKVRRQIQRSAAEVYPEQPVLQCTACGCHCKSTPCGACGSVMVQANLLKGAPFAGYDSFDQCVCQNQDKEDPSAYCGSIKHKVEDKKQSARTADVQMAPGAQTHTREVTEDDDFDPYLITRCGDHGVKTTGDRPSQEHYIEAAQGCHDEAWHPQTYSSHMWEHQGDGSACWSCCRDMGVAKPGERISGRVARRLTAAKTICRGCQSDMIAPADEDFPLCGKCEPGGESAPGQSRWRDRMDQMIGRHRCQACGHEARPIQSDAGPVCTRCGSHSVVKKGMHHQATTQNMNVATADGRILINSGDKIRTPTGQTMTVRQVRKHETSGDHYYLDTDVGTTVVPYSTAFEVVPSNMQQQSFPGFGTPGGNTNALPFGGKQDQETTNSPDAPTVCPVCGTKGSLHRRGDKFRCSKCGYQENYMGGGDQAYSDSPQQVSVPTRRTPENKQDFYMRRSSRDPRSAIAKRAASVLDQMKENS